MLYMKRPRRPRIRLEQILTYSCRVSQGIYGESNERTLFMKAPSRPMIPLEQFVFCMFVTFKGIYGESNEDIANKI